MMSINQKYTIFIISLSQTLILFASINLLFSSSLHGANAFQIQNQTLTEEIEDKFYIKGKVAYGNGVIVGDAEVTLLDTNEKLIETTRTSRKFLKRFGGGQFSFQEVLPGEYIINVDFGTRVGIQKRIKLKDKNLNMGTIYSKPISTCLILYRLCSNLNSNKKYIRRNVMSFMVSFNYFI